MLNNFNPQLKNNIEIQENNDQNKILSLKHSPSFDSLDSDFDTDLNFSESSSSSKSSSSSENEFEKLHKANQNQNNNNNISEIDENSENKYAVEDNIDPSKFDTIENLAINYPFTLDNFQKKSIYRLERNENVYFGQFLIYIYFLYHFLINFHQILKILVLEIFLHQFLFQ